MADEKPNPSEKNPGPLAKDRFGFYMGKRTAHYVQRPPVRKPKRKRVRRGR